jgi:Ran GTPase-activating protein (RanGAP) involved in mRNA processing and transport
MSLMPAIAEADEDADFTDMCTGADVLPQTTLAQMRAVLGRCGAGLGGLPADGGQPTPAVPLIDQLQGDAAGALMQHVDRPLMMAQVSKGWRTAVLGAQPRAPLRYVVDHAKYYASTSTDKNTEMLADLAVKCGRFDVVAITISDMHARFTDASGLAALLPRCPNLVLLDLSGNGLRLDTLEGLQECTALTTLDLSRNADVGHNLQSLNSLCPPALRELHLRDVGLQHLVDMAGLVFGLKACTGLTHLDLRENRFGQNHGLPRVLAQLPALERLELSGTGMRQIAVREAAVSLQACTRLTYLDLSNLQCSKNRIGESGLEANDVQMLDDAGDEFMQMLPSWPALTHLNLKDMYLGTDATFFAASLQALPALTFLDLSCNRIETQGMRNIASALPGLPALAELRMNHCYIEEDGARALVGVLPQCGALRVLKLVNNELTSAGAGLAAAVQQCPNLTFLDLRSTHLEQATMDEIVAAWRAQHEERGECTWKGRRGGIKCTARHFA